MYPLARYGASEGGGGEAGRRADPDRGRVVRQHARRLAVAYLLGQVYLEPHPKQLMLRNHG